MKMEGFNREMFSALSDHFLDKDKKVMISTAAKLDWLRSQIIGENVEFATPFGKRLLTYADHTASGRSLQFIENFILEMVLPVYGNTHTDDSFVGSTTGSIVQEAQKYVKACMGGTDDDALLFCGSGATAAIKKLQEVMGIAVPPLLREQILAIMPKEHRWVVFVGPYEHHSNLLSWRQSLAEVVEIPLSESGLVDMSSLKAALENPMYKERPKLGSFSACSNVTGILSGTRKIARLLHSHGALACFDFAACAPYVKIEMRSGQEDGFDAIFVSPHKFMGGPCTPGLLLMSKDLYLLKSGPPSTCGGGTVDFVNFDEQETLYYDDIEHREDAGTPAIVQKIRTALVFCVKEFLTAEFITARESFFIEKAISRLGTNPNIDIYGSTTVKRIAILSFGIRTSLDLQTTVQSQIEDEDAAGQLPQSIPHCGLLPEKSQSQWKSRVSTAKPTSKTSFFTMNLVKQSVLGGTRTPLPLQFHSETNTPKEEPVPAVPTRKGRGKHLSGRFVVKLLNDLFGIQARGGCSCAATYGHNLLNVDTEQSLAFRGGIRKGYGAVKPGWARVSFGYYITPEEFGFILSAIEFIAEFGARFLSLYDLDWRSGDWSFKQKNEEIRDMVANAEKNFFGEQKELIWSSTPQIPGPALFFNSTAFNKIPSTVTDEYNPRLMSNYLKVAKYLADRLPQLGGAGREIPSDVDPGLITFMT